MELNLGFGGTGGIYISATFDLVAFNVISG